ncbi:MAG: PilT/PilU family type 4a pilus ATPase [Eubacterium sp.]|nr:PilT/PilU family type 4a pilus ATPase [Eubacterium sp.]
MELMEMLKSAVDKNASDIFIISGLPISFKEQGTIKPQAEERINPAAAEELIKEIYKTADRSMDRFMETGDDDFSVSVKGLSRFRISAYKQRGTPAAVIRLVSFDIPDYGELNIPSDIITDTAARTKGLVLVTGPAGGGKSTTLACIIDEINKTRNGHIITLEDPIEYLHKNKLSVISQREVSSDTESYITALRACLRQSPDVILLGEMRDYETISTAMTAAETGHLVISTLHSVGAQNTIDRIIDIFPSGQQQQIRIQLSQLLCSIISQQLIPCEDGNLRPAFEIMKCNNAIRNMIRESKTHQIDTVITSSGADGMVTMDASLMKMYNQDLISKSTLLRYCTHPEITMRKIGEE